MMTPEQLERLLDMRGSDLTRWTPDARAAAERLVAASPRAAQILCNARRLDAALEVARPQFDDATVARVLRGVFAARSRPRVEFRVALRTWGLAPLWPRVGFLAVALALGVVIGGHIPAFWPQQGERLVQLVWPTSSAELLVDR